MRSHNDSFNGMNKETLNAQAGADEMIRKYSGMNEDGLMRELKDLTEKRRREGGFDLAGIERSLEAIRPMLNDDQLKKLNAIISSL